jgi:hypothetical protein
MNHNDIRIARLMQVAAMLTNSGHCRADAVLAVQQALELEKQVVEAVKNSEPTNVEETQ